MNFPFTSTPSKSFHSFSGASIPYPTNTTSPVPPAEVASGSPALSTNPSRYVGERAPCGPRKERPTEEGTVV